MNVLSLFDGISCGRVALDRAGINVKNYYASEVDKYAIKISEANYPDIIRLGDVTNWKNWDIDWKSIDLLIGGSPCQGFSFAGKQLAFDDPRSKLFFEYVEILKHIRRKNPKIRFLLENVPMAKKFQDVITGYLRVPPVLINSALVNAQDRKRLYWANWNIVQPDDSGVFLVDILQQDLTQEELDRVKCSKGWVKWWRKNSEFQQKKKYSQICNNAEKAITLTARMYASWNGNFIETKDGFRKLTAIECCRLMGLSDNYTNFVSLAQQYICLGNAWEVKTVTGIFTTINNPKTTQERLFA